jgi:hypothetical protein
MFRGKQVPPLLDPQMRRLGRVKVSWEMLESFPDLVREALADVLILDAWLDPASISPSRARATSSGCTPSRSTVTDG